VFIDETWASTNMARRYGRAPRGQRLRAGVPHGHWKTMTFVAGLRLTGLVAPVELGRPSRVALGIRADRAALERAAALLATAERPLVMAGDTVAQSRAHAELIELAELLGAPVYPESIANTASFPSSHPLFRGAMVRLAPKIREILAEHDVLLSVGADLFSLSASRDH